MPASEKKRLALRNRLIEVLGEEEAEVLMESLPPFDWHKLATKEDLSVLEGKIEANKVAIEASEQCLRTEMNAGFTNIRHRDGRQICHGRCRIQDASGREQGVSGREQGVPR